MEMAIPTRTFRPAFPALALSLALTVSAAGCASSEPSADQQAREQQKQETIDKILSEPLAADEYAAEERCLSTYRYRNVEVIDDEHVLFRGSGDKMWLNKLRNRCLGLRRNDTLSFELRDNRVCDLDTFDAVDLTGFVSRASGTCTLGTFTVVTPEQVESIKAAVAEARKK